MYILSDNVIKEIISVTDDLNVTERICKNINTKMKRIERVNTECVMLVVTISGKISIFLLAEDRMPVEIRVTIKDEDKQHIVKGIKKIYALKDFIERLD